MKIVTLSIADKLLDKLFAQICVCSALVIGFEIVSTAGTYSIKILFGALASLLALSSLMTGYARSLPDKSDEAKFIRQIAERFIHASALLFVASLVQVLLERTGWASGTLNAMLKCITFLAFYRAVIFAGVGIVGLFGFITRQPRLSFKTAQRGSLAEF